MQAVQKQTVHGAWCDRFGRLFNLVFYLVRAIPTDIHGLQ